MIERAFVTLDEGQMHSRRRTGPARIACEFADMLIGAQPASAVRALYIGHAVIPIAMFLANGLFLYLYDLDERKLRNA